MSTKISTPKNIGLIGKYGDPQIAPIIADLIEFLQGRGLKVLLEQATAKTGLSRCHLIRTFANMVGAPPHRYQIHLRIARARELLARGLSPTLVSTAVGFYDQAHFSNYFRQIVCVTPGCFGRRA